MPLDSVLKSKDTTLPTKVHISKVMIFPAVIYGCESWTIKEAENQRIDWCFWTVVLEKTRVPWTARGSVNPKGNQSWIFIGRTDAETDAEASIPWRPDVKSQLIGKVTWCWERLRAGGEVGDWGRDDWMASPTQQTWVWANPGSGEEQGSLACSRPWGCKESDTLSSWTTTTIQKPATSLDKGHW